MTALPGAYVLESERAVEFQGKSYRWKLALSLKTGATTNIDLSLDNAAIETTAHVTASASDLPALFRRWQGSVVTVWSDTGRGSGFVIDKRGLILTNQHVVGVSAYAAIQFTDVLKIPATIVARSPEKDIAVLLVNPKYVADIEPVHLGYAVDGRSPSVEGEQVFTIGSPLHQSKIMTSGIVSKIEAKAIISDVNINHGNSGGPLFTTKGIVIGVTTFGDFSTQGGPGISGIVRIDEARASIEKSLASLPAPPAEGVLPVEPTNAYPVDSLKEVLSARPVKPSDYMFSTGDFEIALITPVLTYGVQYAAEQAALKERTKRNKKATSVRGSTETALSQYKNWAEYVGEFRSVINIDARPKLVEGFWSAMGRGLAQSQGYYGGPAKLHFKADFYRMRLMCGEKEVTPIHPGKIEHRVEAANAAVNVNDTSFEGFYTYGPDAIGPHCGKVTLEFYTEKEPEKADREVLSQKLVQRIWEDFAAYRGSMRPGTN
jgi:S1-C subfamily serine protease